MSEIAFWVLPCPSAYVKFVTLEHLEISSLAAAVVTSRQLLPPKPSVRPRVIFLAPHQGGAFGSRYAPDPEAEPDEEPPHALSRSAMALAATTRRAVVVGRDIRVGLSVAGLPMRWSGSCLMGLRTCRRSGSVAV